MGNRIEQESLNTPTVFLREKIFYEANCNLPLLPYANGIQKLQRLYGTFTHGIFTVQSQSEHAFYGQGL